MGIRSSGSGSSFAYFQRRVMKQYDETLDRVEETLDEIMQDSGAIARKHISERGVHNTVPNNEGRGTGRMESNVDHEVTRRGDIIHGRFGFLPNRVSKADRIIYGYQESGTLMHGEPSGDPDPRKVSKSDHLEPRGIRPMMAIADAEQYAREELRSRLRGRR